MSNGFGLMIESLVAILLLLTIGYCFVLNKRLTRLKADELALKATISELITATEIAERAIAGLKLTVRDCDNSLGESLRRAERFSADIGNQLVAGSDILNRLGQVVAAGRPASSPEEVQMPRAVPVSDAQLIAMAAQAFTDRTRSRVTGVAA